MSAPVLVLVGAPGAGKTTIGRQVAAHLGVPFRDVDEDIERDTGTTIADIFVEHGEEHFRALERAAVERALDECDGVVAVGGGAVLAPETRTRLRGHRVVHLSVGVADAAKRVGLARDRPVLALNPRARLATLLQERAPLYAEVAVATVQTEGRPVDDVVDDVVRTVASLRSVP